MKIFKPHFWYAKSQRNGVLFLLLLILILQVVYWFFSFGSDELQDVNSQELLTFQYQVDSLKQVEIESRKPKIYPFNPNFITDFKGYKLGMSTHEIDRLHKFRKQNKWINSSKQFQQVTRIPDSLYNKISPYFKFPDWVTKQNKKQFVVLDKVEKSHNSYPKNNYKKRIPNTTNINKASAEDFATVNGVGDKLSQRILKI